MLRLRPERTHPKGVQRDDLAYRAELRRSESRAVLEELYAWLCDQATLTSRSIGKAATYGLTNRERLARFVDDSRIPLDNNAAERGIRGPGGTPHQDSDFAHASMRSRA